ncbi:hypothetical protein GQ457_12G022390 [Hibiscus cannabinus]
MSGRIFKFICLDPSSLLHSIKNVVHTRLSWKYIQRSDSIYLQLYCKWVNPQHFISFVKMIHHAYENY